MKEFSSKSFLMAYEMQFWTPAEIFSTKAVKLLLKGYKKWKTYIVFRKSIKFIKTFLYTRKLQFCGTTKTLSQKGHFFPLKNPKGGKKVVFTQKYLRQLRMQFWPPAENFSSKDQSFFDQSPKEIWKTFISFQKMFFHQNVSSGT